MELGSDLLSDRRHFIKTASLTTGAFIAGPLFSRNTRPDIDYDYMDLHVHTAGSFDMDKIMQVSEERRVRFGIVEHPGKNYRIKNDRDLKEYIERLKQYSVYIGLQPTKRNWRKDFSEEVISQVDYILMDPQTIPNDDGSFMGIWNFDTRVDDTEVFMKKYMAVDDRDLLKATIEAGEAVAGTATPKVDWIDKLDDKEVTNLLTALKDGWEAMVQDS